MNTTHAKYNSAPAPAPRRSLWPVSIITFFCLAIVAMASFIAYCNLHSEELVSADYYEQEVRFQGRMERVQRTQALGTRLVLNYDPTARVIHLQFPSEAFGDSTSGHVELYRPSASQMDRNIKLDPRQGARQNIDASHLSPGLWKIRVTWSTAGHDYFVEEKLVLPANGE